MSAAVAFCRPDAAGPVPEEKEEAGDHGQRSDEPADNRHAEEHRAVAESARMTPSVPSWPRRRGVRDQHREALEMVRQEREHRVTPRRRAAGGGRIAWRPTRRVTPGYERDRRRVGDDARADEGD
jgi:hypothetical protein